jgi:NTE family protein
MAIFDFLRKKKNVTLVLGGGSARGFAHIGVLKVLERERIPIHHIVGSSMGALIGAAYALGIPLDVLEEKALKFKINDLLDPTIPRMGLLSGDKLEAVIKGMIDHKSFEDCKIPLTVVASAIETNEEIAFKHGNLVKIVRASCSWPGIFNPVRIDGKLMVDGGIKNSVPTKLARQHNPDYMIAVDVGFCVKYGKMHNIFDMLLQSFQIMGHELNQYQASEADIGISVDLGDIDQAAFHRAKEAIAKGTLAAESKIDLIKSQIGL